MEKNGSSTDFIEREIYKLRMRDLDWALNKTDIGNRAHNWHEFLGVSVLSRFLSFCHSLFLLLFSLNPRILSLHLSISNSL